MGKTIFDLVTAKELAAYYTASPSNKIPYLGQTLFPRKKQLGLDLSWIKGSKGIPVVLKPSVFDSKAPLRDRVGLKKIETEMPFFKEGMLIKEKDRQELNKIIASGNQTYIDLIVSKIFDDVLTLVDGALAQEERLRMQLLATGLIDVSAEGVDYSYDYQMPSDHKGTVAISWADENATPLEDIMKAQEKINDDLGVTVNRAITTRREWNYLKASKEIKMDIDRIHGTSIVMTDSMLTQYLQAKYGLTVQIYNKKYKDEQGVTKNYYPEGTFTLIPEGNLGSTYFGTTPEESDLLNGGTDAQVSIINTGMAITTTKQTDPVNVNTKLSMITLPSFERIDEMYILDTKKD